MADTGTLYGPALAVAHRELRSEPKLQQICCAMRHGILAHPWTRDPAVADYLAGIKPHRRAEAALRLLATARKRMNGELDQLHRLHSVITGTAEFARLPEVAQRCFHILHARALDPMDGGPNVKASVRVLAGTIAEVYGREYSPRAISYGVRCLAEAGFLVITHGIAYKGIERAVASIYHLLRGAAAAAYFTSPEPGGGMRACEVESAPQFLAAVQRAFRNAIELVRRFKRLLIADGYKIDSTVLWASLLEGHRKSYHGPCA